MSEQPNNVTSLDDYRQGSRFDGDTQFDLHRNITVPKYDNNEIAKIHQLEAARQAREAALTAERNAQKSGPEIAEEMLTNLGAVRKAAEAGQIRIAS